MLHFTAFEASFNGSQQQFPLFAHFSGSPGWERQRWKNLWWDPTLPGPDAHQAFIWAAQHPQNIDQQGKFGPFGFFPTRCPSPHPYLRKESRKRYEHAEG